MSDDPEVESRVRARVGKTLRDKYTLTGVLGVGGMAAVYSATHRNGRQVAVKLLHPELAAHTEARTRFSQEGLVANRVRHPGVVVVLDDDVTEEGAPFLVMELLTGATLDDLWERSGQRLPLPAVIAAGVAVLDVLESAHAAGVVHRDIKPANIFLTQSWQVKILDFGISRLAGRASATLTQTGTALGSPAFMAPEQALGRIDEIDARTDVWSVAASLFTLASGSFVHVGQSGQELLIRAATAPARSLATVLPDVPPAIAAVLDRGLAFRREERWASAAEMGQALAEASIAAFGEAPSVSAFAPLLEFAPSSPPPAMRGSMVSLPQAGGVFTGSRSNVVVVPDDGRRGRWIALLGVASLGLISGFGLALSRLSSPSPAGSASAASTQASTPTVVRTSASAAASGSAGPADPAAPDPSSTAAVASVAAKPAPPSRGAATPPRPAPAPRAATAPDLAGTTRPRSTFIPGSSPGAPPAPTPANTCVPPYRFDFFGNKVQKPGC